MQINWPNLLYIIPVGFIAIFVLDVVIWRVNGWWEKRNQPPKNLMEK
jgi:hypothetical protein